LGTPQFSRRPFISDLVNLAGLWLTLSLDRQVVAFVRLDIVAGLASGAGQSAEGECKAKD